MVKMKRWHLGLLAIVILVLVGVAFVLMEPSEVRASSRTIYVDDDGGADYTSIQDAIDNARDGDTVFVYRGKYTQDFVIGKSINLIGEDRYTTIIDVRMDSGAAVEITDNRVNISGFTIATDDSSSYTDLTDGIIINSNYNTVSNNIFLNNTYRAIRLTSATNNIITNNSFKDNGKCIYLYSNCNNNTITRNNISSNEQGIEIDSSHNNIITDNDIKENDYEYASYGVLLTDGSRNNTITGNNMTGNGGYGVWLTDGSRNNTITGNNITGNSHDGICLYESGDNNIITGNEIKRNEGIDIFYSSHNTITNNNIISNYDDGIYLVSSNNNFVNGNNIKDNDNGIQIKDGSNYNVITGNNLTGHKNGINITSSNNNVITNNNIILNSYNGIEIFSSNNNTLTGNNINSNNDYGVHVSSSNDNLIYHNNFIDNAHNAYDDSNNNWDNGSRGNYWDDYTGKDTNGNGIGDTPYIIPDGSSKDNYPLINPEKEIHLNNPPSIPSKPSGESSGNPSTSYNYETSATDSDGDQIKYYFDWDDGTGIWTNLQDSGQTASKSHTWSSTGTYNVRVKARDEYGAESDWSAIKTVSIEEYVPPNQAPTCSISANPISGHSPLDVTLSLSASDTDGSISSWMLDIDNDGSADYSGSGNPPATKSHTYQNVGEYTAKLTVTDEDGADESDTVTIEISEPANQPPTCSLSANITSGTVPLTVTFSMSASDTDGSISSWELDINNDGNADFSGTGNPQSTTSHTYQDIGEHTAKLTVTDNAGATDSDTTKIIVNAKPNQAPTASFDYTPKSPEINHNITFSDTSNDTDGDIVNCSWSLGDGNISYGSKINHSYSEQGEYIVTISVTDDDGAEDTYSQTIKIGSGENGGMPGFGLALLVMAIAAILVLKRRNSKGSD